MPDSATSADRPGMRQDTRPKEREGLHTALTPSAGASHLAPADFARRVGTNPPNLVQATTTERRINGSTHAFRLLMEYPRRTGRLSGRFKCHFQCLMKGTRGIPCTYHALW